MDLTEKLRTILSERYGINSDEELIQAVNSQQRADIGIFVSPCAGPSKKEWSTHYDVI